MVAHVYTLPGCDACRTAKELVVRQGHAVNEVAIDNPLVELGVQMVFRDRQVHAPVVVLPGEGVYVLNTGDPPQLLRVLNLEPGG